jgi:hypothetical protein
MSKPKFRSSAVHGRGSYLVFLDGEGEAIGMVVKKVEHFNIAPKGLTVTSWSVRSPFSTEAYGIDRRQAFTTRREAVRALLRARKWEKVPPIGGGHTDVWKCLSDCCGALCRESGRDSHDDNFHAEEVTV